MGKLKHLLWLLVAWGTVAATVLWLSSHAYGQVTITGPESPVAPMQLVILQLDGVDAETFNPDTFWVIPKEGITSDPYTDPGGNFVLVTQALRSGLFEFRLAVGVPDKPGECVGAEFTLTVEGTAPSPQPCPAPVPGKRFVLVIEETGQRTTAQAAVVFGLRTWATQTGTRLPILDQDVLDPSNTSPAWLTPFLEAIKTSGQKLPVIVASQPTAGGGVSFAVEPLPVTTDAAIAAVKKARGT